MGDALTTSESGITLARGGGFAPWGGAVRLLYAPAIQVPTLRDLFSFFLLILVSAQRESYRQNKETNFFSREVAREPAKARPWRDGVGGGGACVRARAGEGCLRENLLQPLHRGSRGGSGRGPACLSTKGSAPHAGARCSARAVAEHVWIRAPLHTPFWCPSVRSSQPALPALARASLLASAQCPRRAGCACVRFDCG